MSRIRFTLTGRFYHDCRGPSVNIFHSERIGGGFDFECSAEQGALLVITHSADRHTIHKSGPLLKHMATHWKDWWEHIKTRLSVDIPMDKLMFVSGVHKTSDWAVASYTAAGKSASLHFDVDFTVAAGSFSLASSTKIEVPIHQQWGPQRTLDDTRTTSTSETTQDGPPKKDQCIFLNYYKLKRRMLLGPKIMRAAAGYDSLPPAPPGDADNPRAVVEIMNDSGEEVYELEQDRPSFQASEML